MIQMITYEYKLYSSRRNKKLNKMIDLSAIIWNHCIHYTEDITNYIINI